MQPIDYLLETEAYFASWLKLCPDNPRRLPLAGCPACFQNARS